MLIEPFTSILIFIILVLLVLWLAGRVGVSENTRNIILVALVAFLLIWLLRGNFL